MLSVAAMKSFAVELEPGRPVVWTIFRGVVTPDAIDLELDRTDEEVSALKRDFIVVADLTDVEEIQLECVGSIGRMMDRFLALGVGRVVRIIPDPDKDFGFTILSHTHYRGRVPFQLCASRAEAETALAGIAGLVR